jgi:hypothetical protein
LRPWKNHRSVFPRLALSSLAAKIHKANEAINTHIDRFISIAKQPQYRFFSLDIQSLLEEAGKIAPQGVAVEVRPIGSVADSG